MWIFGRVPKGDSSSFVIKDTFASASHGCLSEYPCLDLENILVISFLDSPSGCQCWRIQFLSLELLECKHTNMRKKGKGPE